jgi:hypothetical protein
MKPRRRRRRPGAGLLEAHHLGGHRVAAREAHRGVVDDDAVGHGVESLLPDLLAGADGLQQARVVERERGHLREAFEQFLLVGRKAMRGAIADDEQAQSFTARAQPHEREIAQALGAVERKLARGKFAAHNVAHFDDRHVVGGGGLLREHPAQRVDDLFVLVRERVEAARRLPRHRALGDRDRGDARRVRAHDATHHRHHAPERRRALAMRARRVVKTPATCLARRGRRRRLRGRLPPRICLRSPVVRRINHVPSR